MQTKNLPWEGYGYFLEPHILINVVGFSRGHVTRILLFWVNSVLNSVVSAFIHTKYSSKTLRKISNEFFSRRANHNIFGDF